VVLIILALTFCNAGAQQDKDNNSAALQEHYNSAQNLQASGNLARAAEEYRTFLTDALRLLGTNWANLGLIDKAAPLFSEAIQLQPADPDLRLDFAEACRRANDLPKARSLAQAIVAGDPKSAKARLEFGRILMQMKENAAAAGQLEEAVALAPNFENGYALAGAYLHMKEESRASRIFAEMLASFGDSPEIHMKFGSAYAEAGYPEQSIQEFKKVISENDKYPEAHYSLGAAYLVGLGEAAYSEAVPEFRKEIEINPNDFYSHFQLGFIALAEHRLPEAETELTRAEALDSQNPDTFLSLGQLYTELNRTAEAEAALRKAIALTTDVTRNHYQVQRAHYLLGRLLLQSGRQEEGKQEMQISAELMQRSVIANQGKPGGMTNNEEAGAMPWRQDADKPVALRPDEQSQLDAFETQIRPAIADSFNNLGAIAASEGQYSKALPFFQEAFVWSPSLEGLDYNWGRAAYSGGAYDQAVGPLGRYIQGHPDDTWARSALAMSQYQLKNYTAALQSFLVIEPLLDADPKTALAYAVCLVKTGDAARGEERLKELARDNPRDLAPHLALADAYAGQGNEAGASVEFRAALKVNPSSEEAKYGLALALIGLQQRVEARRLLEELVEKRTHSADVYYQLGRLQLERDETKAAITTLVLGAKIDPESAPIHAELAAAYRKDSRPADALRETKLYESLLSKQAGSGEPAKQN